MKKIIFLILVFSVSNISAESAIVSTFNFMECYRKVSTKFNQFCFIDPSAHNVVKSFDDTFEFNLDSSDAKIEGSLSDFISMNNANKLTNSSFTPYLTFDYNWNGTEDCWVGKVYNTSVYVYINNIKTQHPLLPHPNNGYTIFREPLLNWQSQIDRAINKVNISTQFKIINERGTEPSPLRQPQQCQFNITNVRIEFDTASISDSLAKLKTQYLTLHKLVVTEIMLNAALLNTQINNKHIIVQAIDMAQSIEGGTTSNLSIATQEYLSFLVLTAADNNTFDLSGTDPFIWLVNNEKKLRQEIEIVKDAKPFPQKDSFVREGTIINQQGYENALRFAIDYEQLMDSIKLGWTLANLTGDAMAIAKLPNNSWLYQVPLN